MEDPTAAPGNFLFLVASSRNEGAAETLAGRAAAALDGRHQQRWLRLADLPLDPFVDIRHDGDGTYPAARARANLAGSDFGGDRPGLRGSGLLVQPADPGEALSRSLERVDAGAGRRFQSADGGKRLWAITIVSDETPASAEPLLGSLRLTADYMGMAWGGGLIGNANRPADILDDTETLRLATFLRSN